MEDIKRSFAQCKQEGQPALVAYVTAGFPTPEETPEIMLSMQAGGANIIELGLPFTDPLADGPTIQKANLRALENGVTVSSALQMVKIARHIGLKIPVLLMGYYNPLLRYGESRLITDCKKASVNGFIIVDLPPEESVSFRNQCAKAGLSYVPLIAPATVERRMKTLCQIADSLVYLVSRMGVTGATATLNPELSSLIKQVKQLSGDIPVAVGFGISTREHFQSVTSVADGAVIGSQIVSNLANAPPGLGARRVYEYCSHITAKTATQNGHNTSNGNPVVNGNGCDAKSRITMEESTAKDRGYFGAFGGQYIPESLTDGLAKLESGFNEATNDPKFWKEYRSYYQYMGRPSCLHLAKALTEFVGGANIWLKREDLNHTGSHKINNALGQVLLARRLGKTAIIAETGAGQHGVAIASVCAKFSMKCTIYMGEIDLRRQPLNVSWMRSLGADIVPVKTGNATLRDAMNEAFRACITRLDTAFYVPGSAVGPHPFPTIVQTFQSVIGEETKAQMHEEIGRLPDAVVACVGRGSNAVGMFHPFSPFTSVKLLGVEAGGGGLDTSRHAAALNKGETGVLHSTKTYILQDRHGQIAGTHSIAAGLNYPGVAPQLARWQLEKRAAFTSATDAEALQGFRLLSCTEGIVPALETAHAVWGAVELAKELGREKDIVLCVSGAGYKDMHRVDHGHSPNGVNGIDAVEI